MFCHVLTDHVRCWDDVRRLLSLQTEKPRRPRFLSMFYVAPDANHDFVRASLLAPVPVGMVALATFAPFKLPAKNAAPLCSCAV